MAISSVVLFGMLGLALDLGHVYIAKNEAQSYTDSAAAGAALRLDGSSQGVTDAVNEVKQPTAPAQANRWNLGTSEFGNTQLEFSTSAAGPWLSAAAASGAPDDVAFARVTTTVSVPLYVLPIVVASTSMNVVARSVGGQIPATPPLFPYTPMAHDPADLVNFGLVPGAQYTLRWGAGFTGGCGGDMGSDPKTGHAWAQTAKTRDSSGDARGFYADNSQEGTIRAAIVGDYAATVYHIGDPISLLTSARETENAAIGARVAQDADARSLTYALYSGNGRRIIAAPVSDPHDNNKVLGYRAFLLLPGTSYGGSADSSFCGVYIGSFNDGSRRKGAIPGGAFKTRLVQ
jgi:Flp pilus assembly protein TadG